VSYFTKLHIRRRPAHARSAPSVGHSASDRTRDASRPADLCTGSAGVTLGGRERLADPAEEVGE
jgi:hypothetical protein